MRKAKETFFTQDDKGVVRVVHVDQEVADDDWVVKGREHLFEVVDSPVRTRAKGR